MDNELVTFDKKSCRKTFSRMGFAYSVFQLIFMGAAYLLAFIIAAFFPDLLDIEIISWLVNYLPMYIVAVPVTTLILKKLPVVKPNDHKLTAGKYSILVLMGIGLTIAGSLIGNMLSAIIDLITGLKTSNAVSDMVTDTNPLIILFFVVIMAPIVEEFLCRKLIIDHTLKYGEWTAILLSGLIFALIHGNFFQFFYAFALGALMAFIYIRTGRLRYTIIFHMIINTIGGLLPTLLLQSVDMNAIESMTSEQIMNATGDEMLWIMYTVLMMLVLCAYVFLEYGLAIAGIVLFCVFIKKMVATVEPMNIPKGERIRCMFLNPGMILFFIISIINFVIYLIA